jgi:hypothetical protein
VPSLRLNNANEEQRRSTKSVPPYRGSYDSIGSRGDGQDLTQPSPNRAYNSGVAPVRLNAAIPLIKNIQVKEESPKETGGAGFGILDDSPSRRSSLNRSSPRNASTPKLGEMSPRHSGGQNGPMVSRTYNSTNAYDDRQKLPPKYAKPPIAHNKYP